MAPEVLLGKVYTESADVFRFEEFSLSVLEEHLRRQREEVIGRNKEIHIHIHMWRERSG